MTVKSTSFRATVIAVTLLIITSVVLAHTAPLRGIEGLIPLASGMGIGLVALHYAVKEGWYPR